MPPGMLRSAFANLYGRSSDLPSNRQRGHSNLLKLRKIADYRHPELMGLILEKASSRATKCPVRFHYCTQSFFPPFAPAGRRPEPRFDHSFQDGVARNLGGS